VKPEALKRYVRKPCKNGFPRSAGLRACAVMLLLLLPLMASAYTVVLKGGRRVEIPERFTVTQLALTYETAPGINITILMSSIDIPETERANSEAPGALLARAVRQESKAVASSRRRSRELTQADIERGRRARRESESEYERRRVELGLPTLEETRRRTEEEMRRLREASLQSRTEAAKSEAYWRARAGSLKTEIAALEAQIRYTRERLGMVPDYSVLEPYPYLTGFIPYYTPRHPRTRFPRITGNPGFMHSANDVVVRNTAGFVAFGATATQGHVQLSGTARGHMRRGPIVSPYIVTSPVLPLGWPSSGYGYNQERAELISRLRELETQRAGLQARWRMLEEEARRAGALPGWLR